MNSNTQKLIAYGVLGLVCTALMVTWGIFSFTGKTDVASFIGEIKNLLGIVVALGMALGGFHAAVASNIPTVAALPDPTPDTPASVVLPTTVNK